MILWCLLDYSVFLFWLKTGTINLWSFHLSCSNWQIWLRYQSSMEEQDRCTLGEALCYIHVAGVGSSGKLWKPHEQFSGTHPASFDVSWLSPYPLQRENMWCHFLSSWMMRILSGESIRNIIVEEESNHRIPGSRNWSLKPHQVEKHVETSA